MAVTYGGATYYYATNIQGDVVAILDSTGAAVVTYTYDAWGNILTTTGTMASTLGIHNPLRYRGYVYDPETGLYYLQSRYYDPSIGRFINADTFASTGQGILGNNMFAYCRNNPAIRVDRDGRDDEVCLTHSPKENLVPEIEGGCPGSAVNNSTPLGTTGNNGQGPKSFTVTKGASGIAVAPNPNNEPTERHHIVEQCQVRKSGFAREDIQRNSNLIDLPRSLHHKISGLYSSKQRYTNGMRVRDWLATKSWDFQENFGRNAINWAWSDVYGK